MLNVVADKEGVGAAVLIRACAPISGMSCKFNQVLNFWGIGWDTHISVYVLTFSRCKFISLHPLSVFVSLALHESCFTCMPNYRCLAWKFSLMILLKMPSMKVISYDIIKDLRINDSIVGIVKFGSSFLGPYLLSIYLFGCSAILFLVNFRN